MSFVYNSQQQSKTIHSFNLTLNHYQKSQHQEIDDARHTTISVITYTEISQIRSQETYERDLVQFIFQIFMLSIS